MGALMKQVSGLALLVVASNTYAQEGRVKVTTFGTPDCGRWLSDKKNHEYDEEWFIGYISGLNFALYSHNKTNYLQNLPSGDAAFIWADKWCRDHPLSGLQDAGAELMKELAKQGNPE
jgi:hypothetical protein